MLVKKKNLIHCWWECKLGQPLWKTVWRYFKKLKIEFLYHPVISFLLFPRHRNSILKISVCHSSAGWRRGPCSTRVCGPLPLSQHLSREESCGLLKKAPVSHPADVNSPEKARTLGFSPWFPWHPPAQLSRFCCSGPFSIHCYFLCCLLSTAPFCVMAPEEESGPVPLPHSTTFWKDSGSVEMWGMSFVPLD